MAELSAAQKKLAHEEELRAARNRKKKLHRKEVKKQQRTSDADAAQPDDGSSAPAAAPAPAVEIEYVSKRDDAAEDPAFHEFAKVFERFSTAEELLGGAKPAQQAAADPDAAAAAAAKGEGADAAADADARPVSKTRLRKEGRISLAVLKTAAERPEVVELCDATSAEPRLLVYLKGYRHAVPVPQHWAQKRAYLQGKRGVEKKPFQLPDFIAATGIEKIRQVVMEKEDAKKLKAKSREATRPKMHRIDLDYQVLHDAFFKYQTKPKLSQHGDVYWEGKENEVHLREKRPGVLSEDARRALGMGDDPLTPPPWLVNMQRYGPPPSYPLLRVPGLNCAIPEGASYGTHPGGWGKPPVDEHGNPLYGNPFAPPVPAGERPSLAAGAVDATPWGELDSESEAESDDDDDVGGGALAQDVDDDAVSRGISSVASLDPGTDTPHALQLRKERPTGTDTPTSTHGGADGGADIAPRALYQVLEERKAEVGSAAFGSAHTYALAPALAAEPARPKKGGGGGGGAGSVELALDPSELEDLDEETLKRKYDAQLSAHKRATAKEDFSDLVHEHEARKRRKATQK